MPVGGRRALVEGAFLLLSRRGLWSLLLRHGSDAYHDGDSCEHDSCNYQEFLRHILILL
jgi:hypothetical protein